MGLHGLGFGGQQLHHILAEHDHLHHRRRLRIYFSLRFRDTVFVASIGFVSGRLKAGRGGPSHIGAGEYDPGHSIKISRLLDRLTIGVTSLSDRGNIDTPVVSVPSIIEAQAREARKEVGSRSE